MKLSSLVIWVCLIVLVSSSCCHAQSELPRTIPGVVSSGVMLLDASLGFYLPTNTSTGLNFSAPFQASSNYLPFATINMTAFCAGYQLTTAVNEPTLILHTFSADNTSFKIEFLSNDTATPMVCAVDTDCRTNNTFWKTQWPQYMLPNNASNPCAFCYGGLCRGHVDVAANGTIITQPSVCPYAIQYFKDSANGVATNVTVASYPALPLEVAVATLYASQPMNATSFFDCQLAAETIFGVNGEVYGFDESTNSCYIIAECNVQYTRPAIYGFSSTPGTPVPGVYRNSLALGGAFSARGSVNNLPNNTNVACTTSYDCLSSSAFTHAMNLYRNDSINVLMGKPGTPNSALTSDDAVDAICIHNRCAMIDVLYLYSTGPLGWNETTREPEFKCNFHLHNVVVDKTANVDLNTTLFSSRYLNPCTYYETNVSILEVYSPDCPSAVIFNTSTATYQLTVPANFTVATVASRFCHLAIRCAVNSSVYPYDCSGPAINTTYTTNVRGAIYDIFEIYNGTYVPVAPPAGLTNGGIIAIVFSAVLVVLIAVIVGITMAPKQVPSVRRVEYAY